MLFCPMLKSLRGDGASGLRFKAPIGNSEVFFGRDSNELAARVHAATEKHKLPTFSPSLQRADLERDLY